MIALPEDPNRESHQHQSVYEGCQDTGAVIPKRFCLVRRLGLKVVSQPREQQGQGVGQVVTGVGNQRQTVSLNSGGELQDHEQRGRKERPFQDSAGVSPM